MKFSGFAEFQKAITNKKIVMFGTGQASYNISVFLSQNISYYLDNNRAKWGQYQRLSRQLLLNSKIMYASRGCGISTESKQFEGVHMMVNSTTSLLDKRFPNVTFGNTVQILGIKNVTIGEGCR